MKQIEGFWLPDSEQHLIPFLKSGPQFASGPTYQLHKLQAAIPYIKNFRTAIDAGAHCGLWSRPMAAMFDSVEAFEPVAAHRDCLAQNLKWFEVGNVEIRSFALGSHDGEVKLTTGPASTGDTFLSLDGEHAAQLRTLDSFKIIGVDFIKIDCEGYEFFVLKGGEETIRRDRPCIIVEQKRGKAKLFGLGDTDAVDLLISWGAVLRKEIAGDFILSWP